MLLVCLNPFFLGETAAQDNDASAADTDAQTDNDPTPPISKFNYTFESIEVPGVQFLALTASSDFEDYAGYTRGPDGEKMVGFTLIDSVFTTYDFPGSQNTYFYALGNNGVAAGHYEDSEGLHHGVILEDGKLRQYDFPGAIQTEIYGYSDATGVLTGNFLDTAGVWRGFSGEVIVEVPGASATFAGFANSIGVIVGSYIDGEGIYHVYVRAPDGNFTSIKPPGEGVIEDVFLTGVNDTWTFVYRIQFVGGIPLAGVGSFSAGSVELRFPGALSTQAWNINQDDSIVGYYDTEDGRRHGFIARLTTEDTTTPVDMEPEATGDEGLYTFESIDVPGVYFLALTASSDFGDYAGYTRREDVEKDVGFTLIDGVWTTYDFPGSKNTYFYALGNDGRAAGHYEDSDGLYHGVVLENGELREYNFPDAVETEIYGISDATGALTGNFTDASGMRRGFSGDTIIEYPDALGTFSDFVNSSQNLMVGSYIDAEGIYHPYVRYWNGTFTTLDLSDAERLEYYFVHGINDANNTVARSKAVDDVPRTYVGQFGVPRELRVPGSVSTEGWNINQDGSVVGHYDSPDGRRHGFIARPATEAESAQFGNAYSMTLSKGLNMLSVPLAPPKSMTAKSLLALTGATTIISLDTATQRFVAWTPSAPDDGFPIEGGKGYIVNVPAVRNFAFVGAPWTDHTETAAAAPALSTDMPKEAWAFVVSGHLTGKPTFDGYQISVHNRRTNSVITAPVKDGYFAAATADLTQRSVVQAGDTIEVRVIGPDGNIESQTRSFKVTPEDLANAVLSVKLDSIGQPTQKQLLQNYPNPFNPETWIPYQLSEDSPVSVSIYDSTGKVVRTLSLGLQSAGFYNSRERAAYWDGKNAVGEPVATGVYFYTLTAGDFSATRKMLIRK